MTERKGDWIQLYSGRQYWPLDPRPEDVVVEDIAHHLGNLCRYTGATINFYSVAQHAIMGSIAAERTSRELAFAFLHHDDTEAVLHDIPRPLKRLPEFAWYREIETRNAQVIRRALGFSVGPELQAQIDEIDLRMLATERVLFLRQSSAPWGIEHIQPYSSDQVFCEPSHLGMSLPRIMWTPEFAACRYLDRHLELGGGLGGRR